MQSDRISSGSEGLGAPPRSGSDRGGSIRDRIFTERPQRRSPRCKGQGTIQSFQARPESEGSPRFRHAPRRARPFQKRIALEHGPSWWSGSSNPHGSGSERIEQRRSQKSRSSLDLSMARSHGCQAQDSNISSNGSAGFRHRIELGHLRIRHPIQRPNSRATIGRDLGQHGFCRIDPLLQLDASLRQNV